MTPPRTAQTLFYLLNPTPPINRRKAKWNPQTASDLLDLLISERCNPTTGGMAQVLEQDLALTYLSKSLGLEVHGCTDMYKSILDHYKTLYLEYEDYL